MLNLSPTIHPYEVQFTQQLMLANLSQHPAVVGDFSNKIFLINVAHFLLGLYVNKHLGITENSRILEKRP